MSVAGRGGTERAAAGRSGGQIDEINRARAYAEELGIELEVTFVR